MSVPNSITIIYLLSTFRGGGGERERERETETETETETEREGDQF